MLEINNMHINIGKKEIIKDSSFSLSKNEIMILIGKNGIGKTTLIQTILGLKPSSNNIMVDGEKITSIKGKEKIGYMPTNFKAEYERVKPFLKHMAFLSGYKDIKQIDILLEKLGIKDKSNSKLKSLSSGEMKKVLFIQAFLSHSEYLILDEPLANLDLESKVLILNMLKESKKGIFVITHNLNEFINVMDRIITIKKKQIIEYKLNKEKKPTTNDILRWLEIEHA